MRSENGSLKDPVGKLTIFLDWEFDTKTYDDTASISAQIWQWMPTSEKRDTGARAWRIEYFWDMLKTGDMEALESMWQGMSQRYMEGHLDIQVVGWGMANDMQHIFRVFGNTPKILDLQIVASSLGYPQGLDSIVGKLFNQKVDKTCQNSDWGSRPLTPEQRFYAKLDTRWVEAIYYKLLPYISEHHYLESEKLFFEELG